MQHIVHKQKVTVQVTKSAEAHILQGRVSDLLQHELVPKMQTLFDKVSAPGSIMRFDLLKIDIGMISQQNFEIEFQDRFLAKLEEALTKAGNGEGTTANSNRSISPLQSLVNMFIFFLEKGYLPWYSKVVAISDWEKEIINELTPAQWHYFKNWFQNNEAKQDLIIQRMIFQFSDNFLGFLLGYAANADNSWDQLYIDLYIIFKELSSIKGSAIRNELWKSFLQTALNKNNPSFSEPVIMKCIVSQLYLTDPDRILSESYKIQATINSREVLTAMSKLIAFVQGLKDHQVNFSQKQKVYGLGSELDVLLTDNGMGDTHKIKKTNQGITDAIEDENEGEALYVENCGVILLHPFLEMYFEELELISDKKFVNDEAQARAVLLLHYLATGSITMAEFDCTLQKVVCGMPFAESVPGALELSEKEKEESLKLLLSVIEYWPPLRKTSVEGLQSTFLQRKGKLTFITSGWILNVEQKTLDILLGKLPWGFSTIRLPWMENILNVEWV